MIDFYRFEHFKKYDKLIHAVTLKSNEQNYEFSLALHTGEDKQKIIHNRKKLQKLLQNNKNLHFIVANQTHSSNIEIINIEKTRGWNSLNDAIENCDALICNTNGIMLCILTADCVPILLYDSVRGVIGAVHAGWRGTKENIVQKTILKMKEEFGSDCRDIIAGIAPSIGSCCYEVGEEVAQEFFYIPKALNKKKDRYMLDLPYINLHQLLNSGVKKENIKMSGICTACHTDRFFSYRKENGCNGRFMSIIGLDV
jgi:YfiH family protein